MKIVIKVMKDSICVNMKISNRIFKKTGVISFGFLMFFCVFLTTCKHDLSAEIIVGQSIKFHGGIEQWQKVKVLSFDKTTLLYNKKGALEKEIKQKQSFQLLPELKGFIKDAKLNGIQGYSFNGRVFLNTANDSVWEITDSLELTSKRNAFYAAHFVVCQPFKLLDDGVILEHLGVEDLDGMRVDKIAVRYLDDTETSDQWTYYFDTKTHKLVANKVKHNNNTSLIKNLTFNDTSGFVFNAHRKSYTLKENSEIDFLRAEYFYGNFRVTY